MLQFGQFFNKERGIHCRKGVCYVLGSTFYTGYCCLHGFPSKSRQFRKEI